MTITNPSGLQSSTVYYFKVNNVEYSITTGAFAPTYYEVVQLMDSVLSPAGYSAVITGIAPNQDIRVLNKDTRGWDSYVELGFGTSGNDLWTNLIDFTSFDEAVPGRGAFDVIIIATVEPGYGLSIAGVATYYFLDVPPPGTIHINGAVDIDNITITVDEPTGGITVAGIAKTNVNYIWDPEALVAETATALYDDIIYNESVYTASAIGVKLGGTFAGTAEYELFSINALTPTGSIFVIGFAETEYDVIFSPSGGAVFGGTVALDSIDYDDYEASGGAVFAGIADTTFLVRYRYISTGYIATAGEAEVVQERIYQGLYYGNHYYRFDQNSGTNAIDYIGSNDLTLSASTIWTNDSKFLGAANFSQNDMASLTTEISPKAISFWHKFEITHANNKVLMANSSGSSQYFGYGSLYRRCFVKSGSSYYYFLNGTDYVLIPDDNKYHWYYIEYYSGSSAKLYIDNIFRGETTSLFGTSSPNQASIIGNTPDSIDGYIRGFGLVDDVRIYITYRLNATQRTAVFTLSPDPGGIIIGGAAQIQKEIVDGGEYIYTASGGIITYGDRMSYMAIPGTITIGGTADDAAVGSVYDVIVETIIASSPGTYQDFGLGLSYSASGDMNFGGSAEVEGFTYWEYDAVAEPMKINSLGFLVVEINNPDYYLIFQSYRRVRLGGSANYKLFSYVFSATGGAIAGGSIDDPVKGLVAVSPVGGGSLSGNATYSWAPSSGYQELGLD